MLLFFSRFELGKLDLVVLLGLLFSISGFLLRYELEIRGFGSDEGRVSRNFGGFEVN